MLQVHLMISVTLRPMNVSGRWTVAQPGPGVGERLMKLPVWVQWRTTEAIIKVSVAALYSSSFASIDDIVLTFSKPPQPSSCSHLVGRGRVQRKRYWPAPTWCFTRATPSAYPFGTYWRTRGSGRRATWTSSASSHMTLRAGCTRCGPQKSRDLIE